MKSLAPDSSENHLRQPLESQKASARLNASFMRSLKTIQFFFMVLGGIVFAYFARIVVLPFLLAWVAAMTLKPPVSWLRNWGLPTPLAAAAVLIFFLCVVGFSALWLGHPAVEWAKSAPEQVPQLKHKFRKILQPVLRFSDAASRMGNLDVSQTSTNAPPPVLKDNHVVGAMFTWTSALLAGIAEAVVLTFLLLASGDKFSQKLAHLVPRRHKRRAVEISREIQHSISRYLFTVTLINAGLGCGIGLVFWLVGMPDAAMWGGVAALLNFLPFFGPTIGMIMVGLAGLLDFNTLGGALLPVGIYLFFHLLEGYLVTPFALGRRFSLNPVIIFVAFIFFVWLWGVIGALLAVPLLVSLKVMCGRVPAWRAMAEFLA